MHRLELALGVLVIGCIFACLYLGVGFWTESPGAATDPSLGNPEMPRVRPIGGPGSLGRLLSGAYENYWMSTTELGASACAVVLSGRVYPQQRFRLIMLSADGFLLLRATGVCVHGRSGGVKLVPETVNGIAHTLLHDAPVLYTSFPSLLKGSPALLRLWDGEIVALVRQ